MSCVGRLRVMENSRATSRFNCLQT
jgi:hypothetical protein